MMRHLRPTLSLLILMTLLTGLLYPALVWVVGQMLFPTQAKGSLIYEKGQVIGSSLIGQPFSSDAYFWSRPSATQGHAYQFMASGGSQLNPASPILLETVRARVLALRAKHPDKKAEPIPADLVMASGSGLDPHISLEAARYQAERIAHARHMSLDDVYALILQKTKTPTLGFLGRTRVNVLELNLALDQKITRDE
ncbi:MAG: potassium-transporting ATPase subunit KdpC [Bdellovibrionales bacterium]